MAKILVIDDDPHFRALLRVLLESHEHEVFLREAVVDDLPDADVVILDWQLGEQDGLELLGPLSQRLAAPVILSTAHSSPEVAAQAIKAGAYDFLTKPVDEARLVATVGGALTQRRLLLKVNDLQRGQRSHGLVGDSHALRQVLATIDSVAGSDVSVMITGESGTGKELVARALHDASERRSKPFLALNMAAIPKDLVESTLFGHERGAFSGADRRRIGAVEEARGGTLFLDEIGEMPLDLQSKLLRFLQERRIRRVGGTQDLEVDVRIVSATNRDPLRAVADGRLREDLYYRLNVVPIPLPPLRERHGDVALLATHFLVEAAKYHVLPIDDRTIERANPNIAGRPDLMGDRTSLTLYEGMDGMLENTFINVKNRSKTITADLEIPEGGAKGAVVVQGSRYGGWSLHLRDGRPGYEYNWLGLERYVIESDGALKPGKHTVTFEFDYDGGGLGKGGDGVLSVNGKSAAKGRIEKTQPNIFSADETADVGLDNQTPVYEDVGYGPDETKFTGKIHRVIVTVK